MSSAWIFGNLPTYEEASHRAVVISEEEKEKGCEIVEVSIRPDEGNTGGYIYRVESWCGVTEA